MSHTNHSDAPEGDETYQTGRELGGLLNSERAALEALPILARALAGVAERQAATIERLTMPAPIFERLQQLFGMLPQLVQVIQMFTQPAPGTSDVPTTAAGDDRADQKHGTNGAH